MTKLLDCLIATGSCVVGNIALGKYTGDLDITSATLYGAMFGMGGSLAALLDRYVTQVYSICCYCWSRSIGFYRGNS